MSTVDRRTLILGIVLLFAIGAVVLTYVLVQYASRDHRSERERLFSDIALTLENGNPLTTAEFTGKPIIVISWATWCPSCVDVLHHAASVQSRFGNRIEVIAVNRTEEQSIVDNYREAVSLPDTITYVNDENDALYDRVEGQSMPETLVYDGDGSLITHLITVPSEAELVAYIESAL